MRSTLLLAAAALAAAAGTVSPASAVEASFGGSGSITVGSDLGACASVAFPGQTVVGQFTAVGEVQGPGTQIATVRGTLPIVTKNGYWSGCISGAYSGATAGEGKYVLTASSATGEYVGVKQCVVNRGTVTCV